MKMFLAGQWEDKSERIEVRNPFDETVIDTVPKADAADVQRAIAGAVKGAAAMRAMPGYERSQILRKAAALMRQRQRRRSGGAGEHGKFRAADLV